MDVAKLSSKGQLTIPLDIRHKLSLKQGDKVIFVEESDGRVYLANASLAAFRNLTNAMRGEADKLGLHSEGEATELVKDIRRSRQQG
jgi:antitoxin PrlF